MFVLSTVLLYQATSDSRAVIAVTEPGAVAVAVVTRGGYSTIPIVHVAFSVSSDPVRSASESIYIRIHVCRYIYIYIYIRGHLAFSTRSFRLVSLLGPCSCYLCSYSKVRLYTASDEALPDASI